MSGGKSIFLLYCLTCNLNNPMSCIKHSIYSQYLLHWYWTYSHFTAQLCHSSTLSPLFLECLAQVAFLSHPYSQPSTAKFKISNSITPLHLPSIAIPTFTTPMGCFFSRTLDGGRPHRPRKSPVPGSFDTHVENTSGIGTPEEETVKEVLSETPIAKPCGLQKTSPNFQEDKSPELKVKSSQMEEGVPSVSETSQVTEWCSNMSESVSMATTISEQREGDEASSKQSREIGRSMKPKIRRKRPYSGEPPYRREQRDKCATKRTELLPEKKSRVTCRYTQGTTEPREARSRKLNGGQEQQPGIGHGRRSRSPAARTVRGTNKIGNVRNSAMKVTERAGDPLETVTTEKRDEGKVEEKPVDGDGIQPPNESIENPLVSLECFIFL